MKKVFFILIYVFWGIILVSCGNSLEHKKEIENIKKGDNLEFKSLSLYEISDLIKNDGKKVIYFSRKTCDRCIELDKNLNQVLDNNIQEKIYLFDTDKARNENNELMKEILDEIKVETVPTIIYFEGSNETDRYDTLGDLNNLKEWFHGKL